MIPVVGFGVVPTVAASARSDDKHLIFGWSQTDGTCVVVVVQKDVEYLQ